MPFALANRAAFFCQVLVDAGFRKGGQCWRGFQYPASKLAACALRQPDRFLLRLPYLIGAAALASYARQADDKTLENYAMRIRSRAIKRAGELLKEFDARPGNAAKQTNGAGTLICQREAAEAAGMSERQQVTAVRVANVPAEEIRAAEPIHRTAGNGAGDT
ncbi:hypothetical protein [Rhizobium binxianense]|uniref:hypothetical protein n=1 Tax=Rhizobium binxianense TaxID=3024242 RepID=UPI00234F0DF9|nr:hypothetical protein [Rhizobium sp. BC56]MDC7742484.1 hypothetical protein [Rhizobium sp. BC56]